MKNLIPWLCAALLGIGGAYFYTAHATKDEELAAARRRHTQEIRNLNVQLDSARAGALAQNEDINQLKKESNDSVRLRHELQQLRDEKQKLEQQRDSAQQEVKQLRAANEQFQAAARKNEESERQNEVQREQMRRACFSQLRQIDLAKQQWALEKHQLSHAKPTARDIGLHVVPVCPAGGTYDFGAVEKMPTCSIAGHTLSAGRVPAK